MSLLVGNSPLSPSLYRKDMAPTGPAERTSNNVSTVKLGAPVSRSSQETARSKALGDTMVADMTELFSDEH